MEIDLSKLILIACGASVIFNLAIFTVVFLAYDKIMGVLKYIADNLDKK